MSLVGACIFAGNNTKWKGNSYRVNGQLIGYEKLNEKLEPVRGEVPGRKDLVEYTIKPLDPTKPEFKVVCLKAEKIGDAPVETWTPGNITVPMPGRMKYEYRQTLEGAWVARRDSTAVFEAAGKGLKELYAGSQALEFFNVHDDTVEGGTKADSLRSFMEQMNKLNGNLDFFAYAGHGNGGSLGSACLSRKSSPEYADFIKILRRVVKPGGTIIFYACLTGVENGFAQSVSTEVPNVTVFAHRSRGHGQTNPEKVRIYNGFRETFEKLLGEDYARWSSAIKSGGDLWRRYPFMSIEELKAELQSVTLPEKKPGGKKKAA